MKWESLCKGKPQMQRQQQLALLCTLNVSPMVVDESVTDSDPDASQGICS